MRFLDFIDPNRKKCAICGKYDWESSMKSRHPAGKRKFFYHESCVRPVICEPRKYDFNIVENAIEVWFAL